MQVPASRLEAPHTSAVQRPRIAQLVGGLVLLQQVQDVIVRNLRLSGAHDPFPA